MFCMNCGTNVPEGAKFCFGCGKPIEVILLDNSLVRNSAAAVTSEVVSPQEASPQAVSPQADRREKAITKLKALKVEADMLSGEIEANKNGVRMKQDKLAGLIGEYNALRAREGLESVTQAITIPVYPSEPPKTVAKKAASKKPIPAETAPLKGDDFFSGPPVDDEAANPGGFGRKRILIAVVGIVVLVAITVFALSNSGLFN